MPTHAVIEPHIWARDLDASRRFYESALGFSVAQWFPDDAPTWFQLVRGSAQIMLATLPSAAQATGPQAYNAAVADRLGGGAMSLYLHVASADDALAACQNACADVIEPIWDPWWGGRQFTVTDPDGNWWTVYQPRA